MENLPEPPTTKPEEPIKNLGPVVLKLWRLRASFSFPILLLASIVIDIAPTTLKLTLPSWKPPFALSAIVTVLFLAHFFWYLPTAHRRWKYSIGSESVWASFGIFWQTRRTVPRSRIQHVDVTSGPLERMLGVVSLHLHTAGSPHAVLVIPGLSPSQAERTRSELLSTLTNTSRHGTN